GLSEPCRIRSASQTHTCIDRRRCAGPDRRSLVLPAFVPPLTVARTAGWICRIWSDVPLPDHSIWPFEPFKRPRKRSPMQPFRRRYCALYIVHLQAFSDRQKSVRYRPLRCSNPGLRPPRRAQGKSAANRRGTSALPRQLVPFASSSGFIGNPGREPRCPTRATTLNPERYCTWRDAMDDHGQLEYATARGNDY